MMADGVLAPPCRPSWSGRLQRQPHHGRLHDVWLQHLAATTAALGRQQVGVSRATRHQDIRGHAHPFECLSNARHECLVRCKARCAAAEAGLGKVEFRVGFGEALPVSDGWADVVIANGVLNLILDKFGALTEMARVLNPRGRLQIGDILVQKPVPQSGKNRIDLWTG